MKLLREMLNTKLPNTIEEGMVWLATDPWAGTLHENKNGKNTPEMEATLKEFDEFMTGARVC